MAIKAVVFDIGGVLELVEDNDWPEVWMGRWESLTLDDGSIHQALFSFRQ